MTRTSMTVGSFLFDYLYQQGVSHAFGIPGDFALPTFRWLDQSPIDLITLTHEPSVGFAADGYARVNGLGVAVVTYCVGGLNMLNSVACAYAEKSPMIVISGGPSPSDRAADPLLHHKVRTFDTQRRIYEEVTCATAVLSDPATAADEIMRVVQEVRTQCRPGYIEVPFDVVDMPIPNPIIRNPIPLISDADNLEAAIEDAVAFINKATQPVIIADVELHRHGLTDLAIGIARKFNIPIASTLLSKSLISEQNPLYVGVYSGGFSEPETQQLIEESDCVLMLGAFITDMFLGLNTAQLHRKHSILATTEKTCVGLRRYESIQLKDFLEKLLYSNIIKRPPFANPLAKQPPLVLTDEQSTQPVLVENFFRMLGDALPDDATVVCDTGDSLLGAIGLRTTGKSNFISDAYYLSMGFAVPASVGVSAANPTSRVVTIVGDGAFQMTGIELSTIAKQRMTPVVFLINNDGYGTQRHILEGHFNEIHPWDYPKLCELLRYGKAHRVTTHEELAKTLDLVFTDTGNMHLVEVVVARDDCSRSLRRLGEELGKLRNKDKQG
jgi:TPP-dependent 2-oxoacid decarboxylase